MEILNDYDQTSVSWTNCYSPFHSRLMARQNTQPAASTQKHRAGPRRVLATSTGLSVSPLLAWVHLRHSLGIRRPLRTYDGILTPPASRQAF